ERQRRRIKARLAAPDTVMAKTPDSPERVAALEEVRLAKRDLDAAERDLENKQSQLQPAHPDVRRALARVEEMKKRVRRAEAAVPPAPPPPGPIDRTALAKELDNVERQIASTKELIRAEKGGTGSEAAPQPEEPLNWVEQLETTYAKLKREVDEMQRRVNKLDTSLSDAEIQANQQMIQEGVVLSVIDPASRPTKPQ